jgi:hypothetical protein
MRNAEPPHPASGTAAPGSVNASPGAPATRLSQSSSRPHTTLHIAAIGGCIEVALLLGLVRPLWLFGPRHAVTTHEPLATLLGNDAAGLATFIVTLSVWIGAYTVVLWLVRQPLTVGARRTLWWLPVLFAGTLLLVLPASSKDVYHYVMEGRIVSEYGGSPLTLPPAAFPDDPLYWVMSSWESTPSRYGPLFALTAGGVAFVGNGSLTGTLLGFKLISVGALLGTAWLCAATARRARPELALPAFALVAWNPLALYEAGANAHNDLLMLFFTALALYLAARGLLVWALPALALGVLVKYVVILLAPLLIADCGPWLAGAGVRIAARRDRVTRDSPRNLVRLPPLRAMLKPLHSHLRLAAICGPQSAILGTVVSAVLVAVFYLPFWEGMRTFDALRSASGDMGSSVGWILRQALKHRLGWEGARPPVIALLSIAFAAGYALILWKAGLIRLLRLTLHPARATSPTHMTISPEPQTDSRLRTSGFGLPTLLLYLCTLSWWLWPWYALWLLPLAALVADRRLGVLTAVITCAALAAYVPINFRIYFWGEIPTDHMSLYAFLTMYVPPLVAALGLLAWRGNKGKAQNQPLARQQLHDGA